MQERLSWYQYSLALARTAALRSEDPYVKVGCCLLRKDNTVCALGYNGALPGRTINWEDRDARRLRVIHAETNALSLVVRGEPYLAATNISPCVACLKNLAIHGVKIIVYGEIYEREKEALELANELGIQLIKL